MSVSFCPEMNSFIPHILVCVCRSWKSTNVYSNRMEAYRDSLIVKGECGDPYCGACVYAEPAAFEPEVQLSNVNAEELFDYLQVSVGGEFENRCVGRLPAEDMLERVTWALEIIPESSGLITMQVNNIIYGGRPSDYLQSKLAQFGEVAQRAKANSRDVVGG